jgi:hypothetical protein
LRSSGGERPLVEAAFDDRHQQHVQRRDREETVGDDREREVDPEERRVRVRQRFQRREDRRHQCCHRGDGDDERLQALEAVDEAAGPVDQDRQPDDGREGGAHPEVHGVGAEDVAVEDPRLEGEWCQQGIADPDESVGGDAIEPPEPPRERGAEHGVEKSIEAVG